MLWTEKYRPATLDGIIGQEPVVAHLGQFASTKNVPHLLLIGPHGTGKSTAIACFARKHYGENWADNTTIFQTSDLFSQGRRLLESDEKYAHLYQKNESLIVNFKHILKWYASMRPLDAEFKLMVFEDAHALSRDAQQGLRRIMEQYSGTCRFIFSTPHPSAIIPAISSRCLPLFFSPVSTERITRFLMQVRETEGPGERTCSDDDIDLIAQLAQGDMRRSLLLLQIALRYGQCGDLFTLAASETETITRTALRNLGTGQVREAVRQLETLLIEYGLSADEVFSGIRTSARRDFNDPGMAIALADAEFRARNGNSDYIQVDAFAHRVRGMF